MFSYKTCIYIVMPSVYCYLSLVKILKGGYGDRVVTLSPPTSEAGFQFPAQTKVGKLVVAGHWSALYSTEP